jgi:hypothetical protein
MKLDLSTEAILDAKNEKTYKKWRVALYFLACLFFFYIAFKTIFPSEYFSFSFLNASSLKNTLTDMQKNAAVFYASPFSKDHSEAVVEITLDKKSAPLENGTISVRKSFKAFFYPTGTPVGKNDEANFSKIKDGSIVTDNKSAYIISDEELLPIDSLATFDALGYQWSDAISINSDEGTELEEYKRGKLLNITSAHPDGTIFSTAEDNKLYLIKDGQKLPLTSLEEAKTWSNGNPIIVSSKSIDTEASCELQKNILSLRTYNCNISIDKLADLIGKDYEFRLETGNDIKIDDVNIEFRKNISSENLRFMVSNFIKRVRTNYVPESV